MSFPLLPTDIVQNILSYNDIFKIRNGKNMKQIPKTDKRYEILHKIKRNIKFVDLTYIYLYTLRVNKRLTIKIEIYNSSGSIEYNYYLMGKKRMNCYVLK